MQDFGGKWTKNKIEILEKYAGAYLQIMKKHPYWKKIYFDGFAGSGLIKRSGESGYKDDTIGAARRIIEIDNPISFDEYRFVEKDKQNFNKLKKNLSGFSKTKNVECLNSDCNEELKRLADDLKRSKSKCLAYIDPYGMQLEWEAISRLKELNNIDIWLLIPTGMGVNRLLKRDGNINDRWLERLEKTFGLTYQEIKRYFYEERKEITLFGEEDIKTKRENAIRRAADLYIERLKSVFKFVSNPYILTNTKGYIMYHFLMASNYDKAEKIANDIIKKYNR